MSTSASPFTKLRYGVARVCRVWEFPRSSFYACQRSTKLAAESPELAGHSSRRRRGPRPRISDEALLLAIKDDLARSPFHGEGHRKVWARLRVRKGIRVARKRVLRVMRENNLLSPHRVRQGRKKAHDGKIITEAPNLMWGTDGVKIFTLEEGWIWLFTVMEHWNAECVGWHVCKVGDRFQALQSLSMAVEAIYGSVVPDVARGLRLRMDHGAQFLSDHYQNQIKYWGMTASFAFVEEPETNGVAERFNRTLKEQAIHGRIFRNTEDVREAVRAFVDLYNAEWMVEKMGFLSPSQAREQHGLRMAA